MQILSKIAATAVLAGTAASQGVYVSPGTAYFAPGTFGQTFSDGSYISAGVAQKPGEYNDISYAAQTGGVAANVGYNNYPPPQPFGGFPQPYQQPPPFGGYAPPVQDYAPPAFPSNTQNFQPPPPPVYVAGTNAPSDSNGPPPLVNVGGVTHTGGFKHAKRDVAKTEKAEQWPYYGGFSSYRGWGSPYYNNWYSGPTVTIGQPTAYFAPGTFGQTFSDGGYTSWGVPRPYKKLNKRQVITTGGLFGPTVSVGAPTAYFAPGTFGQTFSDGGYTSWGVPTVPAYPSYYYKREVSTTAAGGVDALNVDGSRSNARPVQTAYGKQPWTIPLPQQRPDLILTSNGFSKGYTSTKHDSK